MKNRIKYHTTFASSKYCINRMLIMVVEDDADTGLSSKLLLEELGYKVDMYTSALKALSAFKPCRYKLIFLDVKMPDMDSIKDLGRLTRTAKYALLLPLRHLTNLLVLSQIGRLVFHK